MDANINMETYDDAIELLNWMSGGYAGMYLKLHQTGETVQSRKYLALSEEVRRSVKLLRKMRHSPAIEDEMMMEDLL